MIIQDTVRLANFRTLIIKLVLPGMKPTEHSTNDQLYGSKGRI